MNPLNEHQHVNFSITGFSANFLQINFSIFIGKRYLQIFGGNVQKVQIICVS